MRLVGGRESSEGRLELCSGKMWGTVCNEGWDLVDARVACRQLDPELDLEGKLFTVYKPNIIVVVIHNHHG